MGKNIVETIVGAVVLLVAAYFLYYAYGTTQVVSNGSSGYVVLAKFDRVDGLNLGGDVRVSGIKVGKVVKQELDPKTFQAVLEIKIQSDIKLPVDTSAEIVGNGLLGEKYLALVPGADEESIEPNGYIEFTQSSISLEGLIGKFMFGVDKGKDDKDGTDAKAKENKSDAHKN